MTPEPHKLIIIKSRSDLDSRLRGNDKISGFLRH